jgi:hypothetical protein
MRLGVMGCIMRVKNKIDPKTKAPSMSVKGGESYDALDEEVANGKRNVSAEVRWRR